MRLQKRADQKSPGTGGLDESGKRGGRGDARGPFPYFVHHLEGRTGLLSRRKSVECKGKGRKKRRASGSPALAEEQGVR